MKKVVFLLVFMVSFFIQARIVEENDFVTNKETLENEINSLFGPPNNVTIDINRIIPLEQDGYVVGWIVNLLPEGWFIASAHTEGAPFILFSDDGSFSDPSFSDDYSLDIKEFFEIHKKYLFIEQYKLNYINSLPSTQWISAAEINAISFNQNVMLNNLRIWNRLNVFSPEYSIIQPYISSSESDDEEIILSEDSNKWQQKSSYNDFLFDCESGGEVAVGCTALATAQVMRLWQHPSAYYGTDTRSFNNQNLTAPYFSSYSWNNMPLDRATDQVRGLLHDVSLGVSNNFGCDATCGFLYIARRYIVNHFKYSGESRTLGKIRELTNFSFPEIIVRNIKKGFPVTIGIAGHSTQADHVISCIGYKKKNNEMFALINIGGGEKNKWWNLSESLAGYNYISVINENIYPADFCGFGNVNSENYDGTYKKCYERKTASVNSEAVSFEDDGVGLTIDNCPSTFNPGQFVKYWCPDKEWDGLCDSIKRVDVVRDDCVEDAICMLNQQGFCQLPIEYDNNYDTIALGQYRPCAGLTLRECINSEFVTKKKIGSKKYTLYKVYYQLLDSYKISYYSSYLDSHVSEAEYLYENANSAGYAMSDFYIGWNNLKENLCMNRRYELDSDEFYENCIEGDGENVPECENQCEFTYSKIGSHFSKECPPCITDNKRVMSILNPDAVPEDEWKGAYSFRMCHDVDSDRICDTPERFVCGTDNYFWYDVCKNPHKYYVLPNLPSYPMSNIVDNCPTVYNHDQEDWNTDLVGDACDFDGDGIIDNNDTRVYYSQGGSEKLKFESPEEGFENYEICSGDAMVGHCWGYGWYGRTLNISGFVGIKDPEKDVSKIEAQFCYCGYYGDEEHPKCKVTGDCGRNHARPVKAWDEREGEGRETWQSANKQVLWNREYIDSIPGVMVESKLQTIRYNIDKPNAPQIDTGIKKGNFSWDWKYRDHPVLSGVTEVVAQSQTQKESIIETGNYPALRLSFAPVNKTSISYMSEDHGINFARYENYYQNASVLTKLRNIEYAFSDTGMIDLIIEKRFRGGFAWWLPSLPPRWWYLIDHFRPGLADFRPMPGDPWEWNSSIGSAEEVSLRPEVLTSAVLNEKGMILKSLKNDSPYQQIFKMGAADFIYSYENSEYVIKMANDAGFFQKKAVVENGIDMKSASVLVDGNKIYMAGNLTGSSGQYAAAGENYNYNNVFGVIDFSTTGAVMTTLSTPASNNSSYLKLIMLDNVIFMITENETGAVDVFRYLNEDEGNETWEFVTSWQFNSPVALNNGTVKDNVFYLPVPKDQNKTEIVSFNGTEFGSFQTINKAYDAYLKLYNNTGFLTAVDTKYLTDETVPAFTITVEGVSEIEIPVIKSSMVLSTPEFCIYENDNSIFPGARNSKGECIPVYNYNYETVSYLDYKKTVAGHKNNLYIGGLTGVRRVEINEDGSLSNSDMLYTGETNNLAVYGNTMYGANYGEIDVYLIADSGSISITRGISSSSCGNVRVYDNKFYTAENKRVRIFDLTDPQNPLLVKTITTSGKVIDLEVVGERLYIYEETTSWFTTKGFTGIYDISDLNSPVRTKYFEKRCTDAEMQSSGPSTGSGQVVYLGCKNGQHKITDTGLVSVIGEKNFVREGFVHDRILYQVFSGALHKSKVAVKIAVCGDSLIENDEICDSDIISCTELSSSYVSGIAACNSTCDGYNESVCETDGW